MFWTFLDQAQARLPHMKILRRKGNQWRVTLEAPGAIHCSINDSVVAAGATPFPGALIR
jgi:hypothetical protein